MLGISLLKTLEMREYIITDCHYQVIVSNYKCEELEYEYCVCVYGCVWV